MFYISYLQSVLATFMGINFCTIPQRVIGASIPQFGTYDETFDEQLRPYIQHLCKVRDQRVECPEATRLLEQLTEECRDIAILSQDRIYENFTFRALVIAYLKACVLYVANGCKWEAEMDEFIRWSLHYDLWCKMRFFYDLAKEQLEEANRIGERGPKNLLQQLPGEFTWGQVESARIDNGMDIAGTREMIKTWMKRGYLLYDRVSVKTLFRKEFATDWEHHAIVAKCALENGKNVADEVPSAMNLQECWDLINLAEQKQLNCMILENCCYDWFEMRTLNMAQHGVFGEILRAQGAYIHNLDDFWDYYWKNPNGSDPDQLGWRLKYNKENRGDLYATHGLGPVAQALDIHRGDRMKTLVSMDTKSVHGKELVEKKTGKPCTEFRNGDHTTTLIRTEGEKVIELQHDVMNPQPYNRLYQLTGTRGFANKYPVEGYAVDASQLKATGNQPKVDDLSTHSFMPDEQRKALEEKYESPILKKFGKLAKEVGGHGGMDFVMCARLIYCLQNGLPLDMDVYDLAEWCAIAELSAISLDNDCSPVTFPDFTRGLWNKEKGYRHAYATPEQEAATEATANAYTKAYKEATAKLKLWTLYDNMMNAKTDAAKKKAQVALNKGVAKAVAAAEKAIK